MSLVQYNLPHTMWLKRVETWHPNYFMLRLSTQRSAVFGIIVLTFFLYIRTPFMPFPFPPFLSSSLFFYNNKKSSFIFLSTKDVLKQPRTRTEWSCSPYSEITVHSTCCPTNSGFYYWSYFLTELALVTVRSLLYILVH